MYGVSKAGTDEWWLDVRGEIVTGRKIRRKFGPSVVAGIGKALDGLILYCK